MAFAGFLLLDLAIVAALVLASRRPGLVARHFRSDVATRCIVASVYLVFLLAALAAVQGPEVTFGEAVRIWSVRGPTWGSRYWMVAVYFTVFVMQIPERWLARFAPLVWLVRRRRKKREPRD